jgi:hypothetical protein
MNIAYFVREFKNANHGREAGYADKIGVGLVLGTSGYRLPIVHVRR